MMLNSNSNLTIFNTIMNTTPPPGLTHPLLKENFAWVDKRLEQLYYEYALTSENYDDFEYLYNNKYSDYLSDVLDVDIEVKEYSILGVKESILGVKESILGVKESILGKRKRSDSDNYEYEEDRIQDNNVYSDFNEYTYDDDYDYDYKREEQEQEEEDLSSVSDNDFRSVESDQNAIATCCSDWTTESDVDY